MNRAAEDARGRIRVGVSGWSYPDWAGVVYPKPKPRGFHALRYVSRFVDAVEVNVSFYRPVAPAMSAGWLEQVAGRPDFRFTAKLHQRFTHDTRPWRAAEVRAWREGIEPLRDAGRLGAVLAQFPWSFKPGPAATERLDRVAEDFGDLGCVVEVRHAAWEGPEFTACLEERGLGFCNIDQPKARSGIGRTGLRIGPVGYVRLHGRNADAWFSRDAGRDRRYDYLYSDEELAPWARAAEGMAEDADELFVMANNHYRGQAMANALQLKAGLSGGPVRVPEPLLATYPFLAAIARPPPGQGRLRF